MAVTILERFPLQDPREDRDAFFRAFWGDNLVIRARVRDAAYAEHPGPLSIKAVFTGKEEYRLGALRVVVDEARYLVINRGRPYASRIAVPADSLSVFFRRGFVADALAAMQRPAELDGAPADADLELVERTYEHDPHVTPLLRALRTCPAEAADELVHRLATALVVVDRRARGEADRLAAARPATRIELYRRLCRARDAIESEYATDLPLARLARIACLSPHHLLRQFTAAFGVTPGRYVARRRIAAALPLLADDELPVAEIARQVGFASPAAFSRAVRRERGAAPRSFRNRGKLARRRRR